VPAGFTLVELIVVVTVIAIILVIAVPGLSVLNADARLTSAQQTINGVTTRAYSLALADRTMTAVRIFPGIWDVTGDSQAQAPADRQHLAIYRYVGITAREKPGSPGQFEIALSEYFERVRELESMRMPEDVWAAPLEALQTNGTLRHTDGTTTTYDQLGWKFVLDGKIGQFRYNADRKVGDGTDFLNADDFLIVCDPQSGVRSGSPAPFRLRAYAHDLQYEVDADPRDPNRHPYQRYSFSGVVAYPREPFVSLGVAAGGDVRQDFLREKGRALMAHRFSGALFSGLQRPQ
jgi:prepilin-type N-terminal cleavage/methylation domain-containing protein